VSAVSLHFRERHQLTHAREFEAVYEAKCRKQRGSIMVFTRPNGLGWPRLGLAVSTRVGNAVTRNRFKRLIREAFRLRQHELVGALDGGGYDLIVSVRGNHIPALGPLQTTLLDLVREAHGEWGRRSRRESAAEGKP
jgi:ribonuclease P protein component